MGFCYAWYAPSQRRARVGFVFSKMPGSSQNQNMAGSCLGAADSSTHVRSEVLDLILTRNIVYSCKCSSRSTSFSQCDIYCDCRDCDALPPPRLAILTSNAGTRMGEMLQRMCTPKPVQKAPGFAWIAILCPQIMTSIIFNV